MKRIRLQFGITSMFVVLTLLGVWLGVTVNRASRQRRAVEIIESSWGTDVSYDYEYDDVNFYSTNGQPPGLAWHGYGEFLASTIWLTSSTNDLRILPRQMEKCVCLT